MRTNAPAIFLPCLLALLLTGCGLTRPYPALQLPTAARLVESRRGGDGTADSPIRQVSFVPRNALVLSGGGMNGAFTAGVLKGWTARGDRPKFDVVTGISTGAIIAPFAFLGPEYDAMLERGYTTLHDGDIFRRRSPLVLLWADSLADSEPLRKKIAGDITPEVLQRIARAHAEGRRLYVGTTDLDAKRLVIWDLTAIAASDDPHKLELFRKVVLASASVPALFPPVALDIEVNGQRFSELHVDGGVTASLFLRPEMLGHRSPRQVIPGAGDVNVHVIVAGKLRPERRPVKRRLIDVSGESIAGVLQSQFEADLMRVYLLSRWSGAGFALAAVPQNFESDLDSLSFDPVVMRRLFDAGYQGAATGKAWLAAPPTDAQPPRGGVRFEVAAQ
jgi:predicted acylesterase/phospholipase RssA